MLGKKRIVGARLAGRGAQAGLRVRRKGKKNLLKRRMEKKQRKKKKAKRRRRKKRKRKRRASISQCSEKKKEEGRGKGSVEAVCRGAEGREVSLS